MRVKAWVFFSPPHPPPQDNRRSTKVVPAPLPAKPPQGCVTGRRPGAWRSSMMQQPTLAGRRVITSARGVLPVTWPVICHTLGQPPDLAAIQPLGQVVIQPSVAACLATHWSGKGRGHLADHLQVPVCGNSWSPSHLARPFSHQARQALSHRVRRQKVLGHPHSHVGSHSGVWLSGHQASQKICSASHMARPSPSHLCCASPAPAGKLEQECRQPLSRPGAAATSRRRMPPVAPPPGCRRPGRWSTVVQPLNEAAAAGRHAAALPTAERCVTSLQWSACSRPRGAA